MGFWLIMSAMLLQREVLVPTQTLSREPTPEFDTWMNILTASQDGTLGRIGFLHLESHQAFRGDVAGTSLALTLKFATTMSSLPLEMLLTGTTWTSTNDGLSDFEFNINSSDHNIKLTGEVSEGSMQLEVETAGERFPLSFPVGKNLMLTNSMGNSTLNLPQLEVGEEVLVDSFDPMTLSMGKARVACIAYEDLLLEEGIVTTKVVTTTLAGMTTKFWVTDDEETVQIVTPFGFTFRKTSQEAAMATLDDSGGRGLMDTMSIRPTGLTPKRGAQRMKIRLSGLPPTLNPPSDDLQRRVEEDVYVIVTERPSDSQPGVTPDSLDLRADPFIQVEHPLVDSLAREIVGEESDEVERARLLYEWVYENIEKKLVLSFPSAIEVIRTREGDCNEHTVLYTALARNLGMPTRIAIGVVWSDALRGFYYHAWPEVFLDDWTPIDPTLGQLRADATHVKLLTGDIEKWPGLLPYFGQMKIEVLEFE